jgi:ribose transport system permease protein
MNQPASSATTIRSRTIGLGADILERGGLIVLLAAMVVFFALDGTSGEAFRSSANVTNILGNQSVTGIVALAMVVPLVCGYFDLSVAAIAGMANVTAASVMGTHHQSIALAILAAFAVALIAGCVNGYLVAGLRLNGLVVTLGTYILIGGLLEYYTKGQTITEGIPVSFSSWGSHNWLGIPRPFWLLLGVAVIVWYVMMHTPFGRQIESIGSNEESARLVGIRVGRTVFLSFIASALLAAAAGVLLTSRAGNGDPTAGSGYLFPALAAVFLGATAIRPGRYNVWGTVFGVFLLAVGVNGFTLLGAEVSVSPIFNGTALVVAAAVSTVMGRRRSGESAVHGLEEAGESRAGERTNQGEASSPTT